MTSTLQMVDPNFVCLNDFQITTNEKVFLFGEGDPISLRCIGNEMYAIGEDINPDCDIILVSKDSLTSIMPYMAVAKFNFLTIDDEPFFDIKVEDKMSVIDKMLTIPLVENPVLYKQRNYEIKQFTLVTIGD